MKCPPDCTCYGCLEKMADPKCKRCEGDGYYVEGSGFMDVDAQCPCTMPAHLKRLEKAGIIKPESESRRETK